VLRPALNQYIYDHEYANTIGVAGYRQGDAQAQTSARTLAHAIRATMRFV
jgi:hypothetical protein